MLYRFFHLIAFTGLFSSFQTLAQVQNPEVSPREVTVFLSGATLLKSTPVSLNKGFNTIRINGLPASMITNSFQLNLNDSIQLISLEEMTDSSFFRTEKKEQSKWIDSLESVSDRMYSLKLEKEALDIERRLYTDNIDRIGGQGLQTAQLVTGSQTFRQQLASIHSRLAGVQKQIRLLEKRTTFINEQLKNRYRENQELSRCIEIGIDSRLAFTWNLAYQYAVKDAGWEPGYTIRTTTGKDEIDFHYQAKIQNQTGETWKKAKLFLKLQELQLGMERPEMEAWEINTYSTPYQTGKEGNVARFRVKRDRASLSDTIASRYISMELATTRMELPERYTIPSSSRSIQIPVKSRKFPATFIHLAVPKVQEEVYRVGRITNWEDMNLVDGPVYVFADQQFVGTSNLELALSLDTLELYCGTSKYVTFNRSKKKNTGSQKFIGTNQVSEMSYEIAVKNNGMGSVQVKLVDQIPVTSDPNVTIEALETSGARLDKESGKLEWYLNLKPGESKIIPFGFSVKYPKSSSVNLKQYKKSSPPKYR
jgi:uncharacterized protein (TIGR02231 family)